MCSFDECSLFTNVPLDETIQICLTKLYSPPDPPTLPRTVLKDLLEFATKKSHFIFDGQYYDQIYGVAMGSPLGPVLANIFVCHFEESWLTNNQFRPSIWFRYVDDTFSLFDSKDTASRFLDFLNSRRPKIKFTMELEENREIPFLDVCIRRDHNTFSTTIHHKKTFTGLYTKWDSFTPRKYKVNLIRTLTYRCLRICSKSTILQSALSDLKNSLLQNGYPRGVINYNVNDLLHKHKDKPSQPTLTVPKKDVTLVLPYLGLHSDVITRRLKSCVNNVMVSSTSGLFFRTLAELSLSFLIKIVTTGRRNRRLSTKPVAGIVMLFTSAKLKEDDRKTEYFKALTQIDHASAVAEHSISTGHNIKWDHFEILASGQCDLQCKIKETLLIYGT